MMLLYHFSIAGQLVLCQGRVTALKMQMRKQSHHVVPIQNILVIISKVGGKVKKCEIFIREHNQINQINTCPPLPL